MISKGCTCKNIFTLPFNREDVQVIYITYQQDRKTIFEKDINQCEFSDGTVSVNLTQEDTLKLNDNSTVEIQIRLKLADGSATKSQIIETYADEVLKNGVI
jgi:hypothetical protein